MKYGVFCSLKALNGISHWKQFIRAKISPNITAIETLKGCEHYDDNASLLDFEFGSKYGASPRLHTRSPARASP